jgi:hypothetical protein
MKTSSCSSSSSKSAGLRTLFAVAGIVLQPPFGPVADLLKEDNPWHGFRDQAPVLTVLRAQKVSTQGAGHASCRGWIDALTDDRLGREVDAATPEEWENAVKEWEPWTEEDDKAINDCSKMPCDIKLNEYETVQMKLVEPSIRRKKFFQIVLDRIHAYQKSQERKEYEFPGDPVDPWKYFEALGLKSAVTIPPKGDLQIRRAAFFPGRVKTLHQVLDRRVAMTPNLHEATLWRRDVYTDHYFDSWGEWADVTCDPSAGTATITQALMLELDLMKKTDLFSKLMRGKMRGAAEDNGAVYLTQWFERLRKRAEAREASTAAKPATHKLVPQRGLSLPGE